VAPGPHGRINVRTRATHPRTDAHREASRRKPVTNPAEADTDLESGKLTVDRQMQKQDGKYVLISPKREKVRTIELPQWALVTIDTHLSEQGPFFPLRGHPESEALLFRGGRGSAVSRKTFYGAAWEPALKAAGLSVKRYRFHSLRHWCASSMLGHPRASLPFVAAHLGDEPETVMRTYTHWFREQDTHAGMVLDDVLLGRHSLTEPESESAEVAECVE